MLKMLRLLQKKDPDMLHILSLIKTLTNINQCLTNPVNQCLTDINRYYISHSTDPVLVILNR